MATEHIMINADMGEGIGNDRQLMPYVSLCSIACGGHTGNHNTMNHVMDLAIEHHVGIGAHPSFEDVENFGRKPLNLPLEKLKVSITKQLEVFLNILDSKKVELHHIKPHGALYHLISHHEHYAEMIMQIIFDFELNSYFFIPYKAKTEYMFHSVGIPIMKEAFIDRAYHNNYQLVDRSIKGSCYTEYQKIHSHLSQMVFEKQLLTVESDSIDLHADTYCIHGDNPNAEMILQSLAVDFKALKPSH
ncbi:MAG: LamB/YcsF family protein [Flavobacteriaceae bacterium]|nr:LamB/YcsF family protein [Flavobacteriaceae bacterium]